MFTIESGKGPYCATKLCLKASLEALYPSPPPPAASSGALAAGAKFLAAVTTGVGAVPVFMRGADLVDAALTGRLTATFGFAIAGVAAIFFDGSDLTVTM